MKRQGFDREILFLSGLSGKMIAAGMTERPQVVMGPSGTSVKFYVWGKDDWDVPADMRAEVKRVGIEEQIAAAVDLFPGAVWEKNDPTAGSYNESYYELKAKWDDVTITIVTDRGSVCERVVVLEHDVTEEVPDPEQVAKIPLVKVTQKKQVVEWQCNAALAEKTAPRVGTKQVVSL